MQITYGNYDISMVAIFLLVPQTGEVSPLIGNILIAIDYIQVQNNIYVGSNFRASTGTAPRPPAMQASGANWSQSRCKTMTNISLSNYQGSLLLSTFKLYRHWVYRHWALSTLKPYRQFTLSTFRDQQSGYRHSGYLHQDPASGHLAMWGLSFLIHCNSIHSNIYELTK